MEARCDVGTRVGGLASSAPMTTGVKKPQFADTLLMQWIGFERFLIDFWVHPMSWSSSHQSSRLPPLIYKL
jgi:hypothetical protein